MNLPLALFNSHMDINWLNFHAIHSADPLPTPPSPHTNNNTRIIKWITHHDIGILDLIDTKQAS